MVFKKTFDVDMGGKTVKIAVLRPTRDQLRRAKQTYDRAYRAALDSRPTLAQTHKRARDEGLWDDERQGRYDDLVRALQQGKERLERPGIGAAEEREVAGRLAGDRAAMVALRADLNALEETTSEWAALGAHLEWLVSTCTVFARNGKRVYRTLEDYRTTGDLDDIGHRASLLMSEFVYGLAAELPEDRVLRPEAVPA